MHKSKYANLMQHLMNEHDLILLESEQQEIERSLEKDLKDVGFTAVDTKIKMKLVTLNAFLFEMLEYTHESENYERGLLLLQEYQEFLGKKLNLNMFTPCDINGKPYKGKPLSPAKDSEWIRWENEEEDFFKAKEKVIFEGFEIQESDKWINFYGGVRVYNNRDSAQDMWGIVFENGKPKNKRLKTIEDISSFKSLIIKDKTRVLSF